MSQVTRMLRDEIIRSDESLRHIARETGVAEPILSRLINGQQRTLQLPTAERLFAHFGMEVVRKREA